MARLLLVAVLVLSSIAIATPLPLQEADWTEVALLPVELGTPQTGAVIIGRRNVYRLPPVGQDGLVTSVSVTMSSEGVQDTVACPKLHRIQVGAFDPHASNVQPTCSVENGGTQLSVSPINGVPWYLSVEGAINSGVTAPLVRYQLCTASASCGATYNFTVEYKTCDPGFGGEGCNITVSDVTLGQSQFNVTETMVLRVNSTSNNTLSLRMDVNNAPASGGEICVLQNFGYPLGVHGEPVGGTCSSSNITLSAPLPGVGPFFWTVYSTSNMTDDEWWTLSIDVGRDDCTAERCTQATLPLTQGQSTIVSFNDASEATFGFTVEDDDQYALEVTAQDAFPLDLAYTVTLQPYDFQNVVTANQIVSSTSRAQSNGIRLIASIPIAGEWLATVSCGTCTGGNVTVTSVEEGCVSDCSDSGACVQGHCSCGDGAAGPTCAPVKTLQFGTTNSGRVLADAWAYFVINTPADTTSVNVVVEASQSQFFCRFASKDVAPTFTSFDVVSFDDTNELSWMAGAGETWYFGVYDGADGVITQSVNFTLDVTVTLTDPTAVPSVPSGPEAPLDSGKAADTRIKVFNWADILLSSLVLILACAFVIWWARKARREMRDVEQDDDDYLRVYENAIEDDRAARSDIVFH